jgi:hypothetical protein
MIEPAPQTPEGRPHRVPADSLQMSVAEKLACEWEARHDVAARGRIADPAPVQHYLEHVRCEDNRHPTRQHHPRARRGHAEVDGQDGAVPPGVRSWLRWGEDGAGPSGSIIPRGC